MKNACIYIIYDYTGKHIFFIRDQRYVKEMDKTAVSKHNYRGGGKDTIATAEGAANLIVSPKDKHVINTINPTDKITLYIFGKNRRLHIGATRKISQNADKNFYIGKSTPIYNKNGPS